MQEWEKSSMITVIATSHTGGITITSVNSLAPPLQGIRSLYLHPDTIASCNLHTHIEVTVSAKKRAGKGCSLNYIPSEKNPTHPW